MNDNVIPLPHRDECDTDEVDMTEGSELPWYAHHDNLVRVAEYLVKEHGDDADQLLDFLRKPWHYDDEFRAMVALEASMARHPAGSRITN